MTEMTNAPFSRVHIVGTGLVGTSIGLALSHQGVRVTLEDSSPSSLALALDYGAGHQRGNSAEAPESDPELVIVATPPDVVAKVVLEQLSAFPQAMVIDVASVKQQIAVEVASHLEDASRYVGTHPMAGRERGGAVSARSDLFTARPWVICESDSADSSLIEEFVTSLGGIAIQMNAHDHDEAVALVSHLPQVVASLAAARLSGATESTLALAGAGLRDVTRIAASDPGLWVQILAANAPAIVDQLRAVREDMDTVIQALDALEKPGSRKVIADALQAGVSGVSALPGKHGVSTSYASLVVVIDDTPGQLARLLTQLGDWAVNLEDLRLEHSPGAQVGFVDLTLAHDVVSEVENKLVASGWRIAGENA
ncbi:MAG: prephenate dehydrogenase [Microbacteriaceae bacterium]|nr:prephenate dehydrogenase [Microbacteriaceae bacterium]